MAGQGVGFNELSSSSNGSDNTKRPGTPQIISSEFSRLVNLLRIAERKAQIKTYPFREKLEKLGVYSSCKVKVTWPYFIVYAHWSGIMEKSFIMPLFSLFPVGSHSPFMVFFSFLLSILEVVDSTTKLAKFCRIDSECVVPENIHTSPTEDSLICTPTPPPGFSVPWGLWWHSSPQDFPTLLTTLWNSKWF